MAEEKKGHVKLSVDIEINEALMDMAKEAMANMPKMVAQFKNKKKEE